MASTFCCIAEQQGRPNSPELPNARVSQATPAKWPLLPKPTSSPSSRLSNPPSEEVFELRGIFDRAHQDFNDRKLPLRTPRARFSRPSMQSLHSFRTITSLRSAIKRRFSRDLLKKNLALPQVHSKIESTTSDKQFDTVHKHVKQERKHRFEIAKDDLQKDLLSHKNPEEGGYDSDAQALEDIGRNVGKRTSRKRPSIHSIDWTPSTASKHTPGSSVKDHQCNTQPCHIARPQSTSFTVRFSQVFSTPNYKAKDTSEEGCHLGCSHSATSVAVPQPSPISPFRLPSLTTYNNDSLSWTEFLNENFCLSRASVRSNHVALDEFDAATNADRPRESGSKRDLCQDRLMNSHSKAPVICASHAGHVVDDQTEAHISSIRQEESTSHGGKLEMEEMPQFDQQAINISRDDHGDDSPRRSVHLYSMRISHHLRSGSLLSWDQLLDASGFPALPRPFRERTVSDQSRHSQLQIQAGRHERQTSSSGFASSKVPSRWGKVVGHDDFGPDISSSIYSSRPQSPPDSHGGSLINISRSVSGYRALDKASIDVIRPRRCRSFPMAGGEVARALHHNDTVVAANVVYPNENNSPAISKPLSRNNSVRETKLSKFREEFSPSPPKRRLTPSASIIKFLNPKRLSVRSQSETILQIDASVPPLDGSYEPLFIQGARERRQSRSLISLKAEHDSLEKSKGVDNVWNRALQAHQEEKVSLFMSKNRDQFPTASPFRERSRSVAARRSNLENRVENGINWVGSSRQNSTPGTDHLLEDDYFQEFPTSRRFALNKESDGEPSTAVLMAFEKQGDSTDIVGAWGRYPSHTRRSRTLSAGKADLVETRDFALEAAIKSRLNKDTSHDADLIDPVERQSPSFLPPGQKKRKKRIGHSHMAKSRSMTFGKTLMKNYTKMFRSQSTEFRKHGKGHRSSIASGGTLEFPELELVPSVWIGEGQDQANGGQSSYDLDGTSFDKLCLPAVDSQAALRPRRNSSAPDLIKFPLRENVSPPENGEDDAQIWSVYYENLCSTFPRLSTDTVLGPGELSRPSRLSLDSVAASGTSRAVPAESGIHARTVSQMSPMSEMSLDSAQPSLISFTQDDGRGDDKSVVSVRRSTMDLIAKFKQQEAKAHAALLTGR